MAWAVLKISTFAQPQIGIKRADLNISSEIKCKHIHSYIFILLYDYGVQQ